jgi:hypothetical protein
MTDAKPGRRRRSSSLLYQEPPETTEQLSDQAVIPNLNANWVNAKGKPIIQRERLMQMSGLLFMIQFYVSSIFGTKY